MCVNDIICHGATPLCFLDYYVTGRLDIESARAVIASIADACRKCNCALVGKVKLRNQTQAINHRR